MTVFEEYVAGTDPADPSDLFRAEISMKPDGTPEIGWRPDLRGATRPRVYFVEGKETLDAPSWGPTNAATRFFRVRVGLER